MKKQFQFLSVALLVSATPLSSMAQMTCNTLLDKVGLSTQYRTLKDDIYNEFGFDLTEVKMAKLDQLSFSTGEITAKDQADFNAIIESLGMSNIVQKKQVAEFLNRPLSSYQSVGVRLARVLGRSEKGRDRKSLASFQNYTSKQIQRKDRILELSGFSLAERFALISNKFASEVLTENSVENFFRDQPMAGTETTLATNEATLNQADKDSLVVTPGKKLHALDRAGFEKLNKFMAGPFFQYLMSPKFDPKFEIGFCFGRATIADIAARVMGLKRDSIKKAYVVGTMDNGTSWRYHVATIYKSTEGGWWVEDPIYPGLTLREWYAKMKTFDVNGDLRLYITESARFGPSSSTRYSKAELFSEEYNNYFIEVMKYFKEKVRAEIGKPVAPAVPKKVVPKTTDVLPEKEKKSLLENFFSFLDTFWKQ